MQKVRLLVAGRVQGVGFRYATQALAMEIGGIYGRVWNNDDGTVEILAQAEEHHELQRFIHGIRNNPSRFAKVTYVDVTPVAFSDYSDFRVSN
ncbi:acylphosphatase [Streptococcus entericus]|uniref:acylphosphatase n=1 Tax=Streptococcus entericus TaxID=155680 RepID=UPI00037BB402|nr:acylphosphatase [Streptococcus entericus]